MLAGVSLGLLIGVSLVFACAPATAQFSERAIRVSNGVNQEHTVGKGVARMAAYLAERSGERLRLQAFRGGALDGDLQATQSLGVGTLEMVITATSPLVGTVPEFGVFDFPFLFNTEREVDAVLDSEFGAWMSAKLPAVGLVNLASWENGFRSLTNSRRAVSRLEDLNGMRIRVMQNKIFLHTSRTVGANAIPMAFGEVFTAQETRAIDGQENWFVTIDTMRISEVQRFLTVTNHAYTPFLVLYSKQLGDRLLADGNKALIDCAAVGRDEQRQVSRELASRSLANLRRQGMQITGLRRAELKRFRQAVKPVYDRQAARLAEFDTCWHEDPVWFDIIKDLATYRRHSKAWVCASETLAGTHGFREYLESGAAGVVMFDLSWCGGVSEACRIAGLAEARHVPIAAHDCTGPVVYGASCHLSL